MSNEGGSKLGGILGTILILGGINLASYLFDWGFWLY